TLKYELLSRKAKLLQCEKIMKLFIEKIKKRENGFFELITKVLRAGSSLPGVPTALAALLKDPQADDDAKRFAAYALREIAKAGKEHSQEALQALTTLLKDPQADGYAKDAAADALGEIAVAGKELPQEALQALTALLKDPQVGGYAKSSAAYSLGEIAKAGK